MRLPHAWTAAHGRWRLLTIYQKFEHAVILVLTRLIAVVIVSAVWHLTLKILFSLSWRSSSIRRITSSSRPSSA